jgi:hypothetical protein
MADSIEDRCRAGLAIAHELRAEIVRREKEPHRARGFQVERVLRIPAHID